MGTGYAPVTTGEWLTCWQTLKKHLDDERLAHHEAALAGDGASSHHEGAVASIEDALDKMADLEAGR